MNPRDSKHVEDVKNRVNLKSAHFFDLCCITVSQCTVQKTKFKNTVTVSCQSHTNYINNACVSVCLFVCVCVCVCVCVW